MITRYTTKEIREELYNKLLNNEFRYDPTTNQNVVEIQDAHFIADSPDIVKHYTILYDNQWYIDNYDIRLIGEDWNRQYFKCIDRLVKDPYSRRAVIYMGSPDECLEEFPICTMTMHMILDGKNLNQMNWIVNMRSNSVIKYSTDYAWQLKWFKRACEDLSKRSHRYIEMGNMFWNADSMHIYEEDFEYLKNTINNI